MSADAVILGAFVAAVLLGVWWVARRDAFYAGFALFFLVYTVFAMAGYRFYPVLSIYVNAYFGPSLYYTYLWFVAGSFAAFFAAFGLLHRRLLGNSVYAVRYTHREGPIWATLTGLWLLVAWMAFTLARIYPRISYGGNPQIPDFWFAFAFKYLHLLIIVVWVFARHHARTGLERSAAVATIVALTSIFLLTALKAGNRTDLLELVLGLLWLEFSPAMLDQNWGLRIRLDRALLKRFVVVGAVGVVVWIGLDSVRASRGASAVDFLPTYATVLFNDYFAPAHILFASMGFHYVKPLLVLKSNVANSLLVGGMLNIPYLQTDIGERLIAGINSRSTGYAFYIFTEGYMALGNWGVLYNGIVPVVFIGLLRRLGRTTDAQYNALVGAFGAMFFAALARSGNHMLVRVYIFVFVPILFLYRFLTGARVQYIGERSRTI